MRYSVSTMASSPAFTSSLSNVNTAERLRDSQEEIFSSWDKQIQTDLATHPQSDLSPLRNFLPELIENLIQELLGEPSAHDKSELLAMLHGESCAKSENCSVAQLLKEYQLLRMTIYDKVTKDKPISPTAQSFIFSCIDHWMSIAAEAFTKVKPRHQNHRHLYSVSTRQPVDYQALFKQSPSLHLILSLDFTILDASDEYLRATLTKREDILGKNVFDVFPDNPRNPLANGVSNMRISLERVVREKATDSMAVQRYDMDRYDPNQSQNQRNHFEERYWSVKNAPILDNAGNILYIIHQTADVTDVFQARKERAYSTKSNLEQNQAEVYQKGHDLQRMKRELERSNMELEQFAYVASHDLREPLRMIASYAQLLERRYQGKLDQKADKFIWYITDGVNRMQSLIQDILTYSRAGRGDLNRELTDFESLFFRILTSLKPLIEGNDATITHDPLPTFRVDPIQISQVFQNLLNNAIKFRRPEPLRIHVSAKKQFDEKWLFSVEDNGIGIESEFQTKVFDLFKRLYPKDQYPGTGLGLAICKKIIERHGGRIWVESRPEKGSVFYFTLSEIAVETSEMSEPRSIL